MAGKIVRLVIEDPCKWCNGTGWYSRRPCSTCDGTGDSRYRARGIITYKEIVVAVIK